MKKNNYCLDKESETKDTVNVKCEEIKGYKITPKVKEKDAIKVDKIVVVSPDISETIIRKKIDRKITYLLKKIKEYDEDEEPSGSAIEKDLIELEKLRLKIINTYVKYLGNTYMSLTLKKISLLVDKLNSKLLEIEVKRNNYDVEKTSHHGR